MEEPSSLVDPMRLCTREKSPGSTLAPQPTGKSLWTGESLHTVVTCLPFFVVGDFLLDLRHTLRNIPKIFVL